VFSFLIRFNLIKFHWVIGYFDHSLFSTKFHLGWFNATNQTFSQVNIIVHLGLSAKSVSHSTVFFFDNKLINSTFLPWLISQTDCQWRHDRRVSPLCTSDYIQKHLTKKYIIFLISLTTLWHIQNIFLIGAFITLILTCQYDPCT